MKILHVITGMAKAAGTSTFCGEVCNQLVALGHDVTVAVCCPSSSNHYPLDQRVHFVSIESVLHSVSLNSCCNLVHIHALWTPILHKIARRAHKQGIPVVWSTHGMTAPWSLRHKWWKKMIPWFLYQKRDLARADLVHCTSDIEIEWNRKHGFVRNFLAPLGTKLPSIPPPRRTDAARKTLLYVGRIYPVKAIDQLIEAFAITLRDPSLSRACSWTLRLVGPDQSGYMKELMSLCSRLNLTYSTPDGTVVRSSRCQSSTSRCSDVQFAGSRYNQELEIEYAQCDVLALVSHTENFGATVIEAMAHGKPVLTSTKTPWGIVSERNCGWWVDNDKESLARVLMQLFAAKDDDLKMMGERGLSLVKEQYTWLSVARTLETVYGGIQK